jgi:hypothetical protein
VDPFQVSCETCRTRLRVRDERVVGQIHACPKCGSMVHIAAPAGWATPNTSAAALAGVAAIPAMNGPVTTAAVESSAASTKFAGVLAHLVHSPAMLWSAGGVALLSLAGLGAAFAWHGESETTVRQTQSSTAEAGATIPTAPTDHQSDSGDRSGLAAATHAQSQIESPTDESPAKPIERSEGASQQSAIAASQSADRENVLAADANLPGDDAAVKPSAATSAAPRTLKLEPIPAAESPTDSIASVPPAYLSTPQYPAVSDGDAEHQVDAAAKTQADASPQVAVVSRSLLHFGPTTPDAAHRTNVADQVSVPIKSFEMSDAPLKRVLETLANMAAVPIAVDPMVLAAVGVTPDTHVTVHVRNVSLGKLLGGVLREHRLACEVRDGQLVIVGRPGDASASAQ